MSQKNVHSIFWKMYGVRIDIKGQKLKKGTYHSYRNMRRTSYWQEGLCDALCKWQSNADQKNAQK